MKNNILSYLETIKENIFFSSCSYGDLKYQIENLKLDRFLFQKISSKDPIYFAAHFFKSIIEKKIPVILSPDLGDYEINKIQNQIDFTQCSHQISDLFPGLNSPFIIFSSGTTGDRAGIVHEFESILKHCEIFNQIFPINKNETFAQLILPFSVGGFMLLMRAFYRGSKVEQELNSSTHFVSIVPTQIFWVTELYRSSFMSSNLKGILIGGASVPKNLEDSLIKLNLPYFKTYGMTETLSFIMLNDRPISGVEIKLESPGCTLAVKSPSMLKGKMINKCFIPFIENFYHTSDIAKKVNDDHFLVLGRADDTINSGGIKINLSELKTKIAAEIGKTPFLIFGIKNEYWGQSLALFYQADLEKPHFKTLLNYEIPKFVFTRPKSFFSNKPSQGLLEKELFQSLFEYFYVDREAEKTVIFFHGFMENFLEWKELLSETIQNSNLLFINLPGHGNSDVQSFRNSAEYLALLYEFVSSFNINSKKQSFTLMGYSMGGRIALNLSFRFKNPNVILISSSVGLKNEEINMRENLDKNRFQAVKSKFDFYHFLKTWYENPIFGNFKNEVYFENYISDKSQSNYLGLQASLNLLGPTKLSDFEGSISKMFESNINLTLIAGQSDLKYSREIDEIKTRGLNFNSYKIDNAFHKLHMTHKLELQKLLKTLF